MLYKAVLQGGPLRVYSRQREFHKNFRKLLQEREKPVSDLSSGFPSRASADSSVSALQSAWRAGAPRSTATFFPKNISLNLFIEAFHPFVIVSFRPVWFFRS